jgi:hypothetical protein
MEKIGLGLTRICAKICIKELLSRFIAPEIYRY